MITYTSTCTMLYSYNPVLFNWNIVYGHCINYDQLLMSKSHYTSEVTQLLEGIASLLTSTPGY